MKKTQINNEHKALIESVIRENAKFKGHEELLELFFDAVYKKSYLLIDAIRDMPRLKRHLAMISDSCMEQIIKEQLKFDKIRLYKKNKHSQIEDDIVSVKNSPLTEEEDLEYEFERNKLQKNIVNLKEEIQRSERYESSDLLIDPIEFCPKKRVSEHTLEKLIELVKKVDDKFPKKRYYEIFSLRYIRKYNQMEIARQMKISQVELSKRFVELIQLAREAL